LIVNQATLSVIMQNFNHAKFLGQSLQAILDQSFQPKEVIVVDDRSTDNSVEVIKSFAQKYPLIRLVQNEKNMGINYTFRRGMNLVTGTYFISCAADDMVSPGLFEKSMNLLAQHPQAGFSSTLIRHIDENGKKLSVCPDPPYFSKKPCHILPDKALKIILDWGGWWVPHTGVWRTQAIKEAGGFPEEAGNFLDGFTIPLMFLNYGACFIPEPLGMIRIHSENFSTIYDTEPEKYLELVKPMHKLMTAPAYRGKFPSEYIEDVKKRDWYAYGSLSLNKMETAQKESFESLNRSLSNSLLDRIFLCVIKCFAKLNVQASRFYLFWRLRRFNWFIVMQSFHRLKKRAGIGVESGSEP